MDLRALIFDMDGTLIHTDDLHFSAYVGVLADEGITLERDRYDTQMSGRPNLEILRDLFPELSNERQRELMNRKEAAFRGSSESWETLAGLSEVLSWAAAQGLKRALVTSAPRENVDFLLQAVGLENTFDPLIYADELARGKPDPLPYQVALEHLALKPEQVLVFEDSLAGVASAVGAGVSTIGVATTQRPEALSAAGATLVIGDFNDAALWEVLRAAERG